MILFPVPLPYKNTLPTSSGVPVGLVVVLQASVFLYGIKYSMIVQSILNIWDRVYDSNRKTVYTTLEDPVTHKKVLEVNQYLYDDHANVPAPDVKGKKVDVRV